MCTPAALIVLCLGVLKYSHKSKTYVDQIVGTSIDYIKLLQTKAMKGGAQWYEVTKFRTRCNQLSNYLDST